MLGTIEGIKKYFKENYEKLLSVHFPEYNGVIVFLPIEYDKKFERIFYTTSILMKHALDKKKEIQNIKKRGLMEKDMIQWYTLNEVSKQRKKFRKSNHEVLQFISDTFNC